MVDFLRANPFVTMDQYLYNISIPMLTLMSVDATRVESGSNGKVKKEEEVVVNNADDLFKQLQMMNNGK